MPLLQMYCLTVVVCIQSAHICISVVGVHVELSALHGSPSHGRDERVRGCVGVCVCGPAYHYWAAINECWALDSNDYRLLIAELAGAL